MASAAPKPVTKEAPQPPKAPPDKSAAEPKIISRQVFTDFASI